MVVVRREWDGNRISKLFRWLLGEDTPIQEQEIGWDTVNNRIQGMAGGVVRQLGWLSSDNIWTGFQSSGVSTANSGATYAWDLTADQYLRLTVDTNSASITRGNAAPDGGQCILVVVVGNDGTYSFGAGITLVNTDLPEGRITSAGAKNFYSVLQDGTDTVAWFLGAIA